MQIQRTLILVVLVAILAPRPALPQRADAAARPLAIVTKVHGQAWSATPGLAKRNIQTLDWFADGTVLSTGADASMVVVFQNGMRTQLGERSQLRVTADGPVEAKGNVHNLPAVPPLPKVSAVVLEGPATRINAVRVRGDAFVRLHPDGSSVVADAARLEFEPESEYSSYAVSIEGTDGSLLFEKTTTATWVLVPPGILQPGARYHWQVRAQDSLGRRVRSAALFVTLTNEQVAQRHALRHQLGSSPDDAALLAEVDRSLGLLREALSGFDEVRRREPSHHVAERWDQLDALLPRSR